MNTKEFVISIPKYLIEMLKKWRVIILSGLLLAILFGGYKSVRKYQEINSADYKKNQQEAYEEALDEYNSKKNANELTTNQTNTKLVTLNEYINDSVLMQVDPYNVDKAGASLSFQAEGNASIDNHDVLDSALGACTLMLQEDAIYAYINEQMGMDLSEKYLTELIKTSVDYDANTLSISVFYTDGEGAQNILDAILTYIQENRAGSVNGITVEMTVSDYGVSASINREIQDLQNRIYSQIESLTNMNAKYDVSLSEPAKPDYSNKGVVKTGIKWLIFGFAGGILLSVFFLTLGYLLNGKMKNEKDMSSTLEIPVVGVIRRQKNHKVFCFVDRWIEHLAERINGSDDLAMQIFQLEMLLKEYPEQIRNIMLTGTLGEDEIENVQKEFLSHMNNSQLKWSKGDHLISNLMTVNAVSENDAIILVEKIGESRYKDLVKQKQMLDQMKAKVIGCICID